MSNTMTPSPIYRAYLGPSPEQVGGWRGVESYWKNEVESLRWVQTFKDMERAGRKAGKSVKTMSKASKKMARSVRKAARLARSLSTNDQSDAKE